LTKNKYHAIKNGKEKDKMKNAYFIVSLTLAVFCACNTQPSSKKDEDLYNSLRQILEARYNQDLNETEKEKIESYKILDHVAVDELIEYDGDNYFDVALNRAVYEIYPMLRIFGLHEKLTNDEKSIIIKAVFENIPRDLETGIPIRNIIIPSYFSDNNPLIIHVTFAFSGDMHPTIVNLTNTKGNIRQTGYSTIQNAGVGFQYPRIANVNNRMIIQSDNNYSMAVLSDGIISASSSIDKELPPINENGDTLEMLNLTDDYLRDGNLNNDDEVLSIIKKTISDNTKEPMLRLFANMQLYIYYLFKNDLDSAGNVIEAIDGSGLLDDETIKKSEVFDVAKNDLKNILEIINIIKK
jgi:hypothetical protein